MEYSVLYNLTDISDLLDKNMVTIRCSMFLLGVLVILIVEQHFDRVFEIRPDWFAKVTKEIL
ncbi:MAG: hypothetical protein MK035_07945 [Dehalococcoidia bacterium]|nr:hypothetical protein [Dehalococcoidia bacterium]